MHLVEQPHVLDGDDRLIGEGRYQLDLLVCEWPRLGARQGQNADRDALAQHRNTKNSTISVESSRLEGVFWINLYVGNMNRSAFEQSASGGLASFQLDRTASDVIHEFCGKSVGLRTIEHPTLLPRNDGLVGITKPGGHVNDHLQHPLEHERPS